MTLTKAQIAKIERLIKEETADLGDIRTSLMHAYEGMKYYRSRWQRVAGAMADAQQVLQDLLDQRNAFRGSLIASAQALSMATPPEISNEQLVKDLPKRAEQAVDALNRVQVLADRLQLEGDAQMAQAHEMPEYTAEEEHAKYTLLTAGAEKIEQARVIREAVKG